MFAAGVSPSDAQSNIAGWYEFITKLTAPEWLSAGYVDKVILYGIPAIFVIYLAFSFWRKHSMNDENKIPPSKAENEADDGDHSSFDDFTPEQRRFMDGLPNAGIVDIGGQNNRYDSIVTYGLDHALLQVNTRGNQASRITAIGRDALGSGPSLPPVKIPDLASLIVRTESDLKRFVREFKDAYPGEFTTNIEHIDIETNKPSPDIYLILMDLKYIEGQRGNVLGVSDLIRRLAK